MFIVDKRHGILSMANSKRAGGRSYEEFVDEFMDWWLEEVAERGKDENVEST